MPQSSVWDTLKSSWSWGIFGLKTSADVVSFSPYVLVPALIKGVISFPVFIDIAFDLAYLPFTLAGAGFLLPIALHGGKALLTSSKSALPENLQPLAGRIQQVELTDPDQQKALQELLAKLPAPLVRLAPSFVGEQQTREPCSVPDNVQLGRLFHVPSGAEFEPGLYPTFNADEVFELLPDPDAPPASPSAASDVTVAAYVEPITREGSPRHR